MAGPFLISGHEERWDKGAEPIWQDREAPGHPTEEKAHDGRQEYEEGDLEAHADGADARRCQQAWLSLISSRRRGRWDRP
jgi:hypothetical protein